MTERIAGTGLVFLACLALGWLAAVVERLA